MRKGIQPALEPYLVTAGGGEGAAVVAAAAAASMDKRALLASPGFAAAAPGAYIQILTTNTSTTSCSSSLHSGAVAAGPLLPSAPGAEQTAGSLLYTTPHGPSSRAGLLQQPPALGRGGSGGGGPPVIPFLPSVPSPGGRWACTARVVGALQGEHRGPRGLPLRRGFIVDLSALPRARRVGGLCQARGAAGVALARTTSNTPKLFSAPTFFSCTFPYPHCPFPSNSKLPLSRA
ncbi:transcription factor E2F3-like [Sapajus apella]|uniref:Transcription factor E2F3-like n=1 Tax=Sapajus apella TaxID=9515 RepID=A0A6J3FD59_SAPAP|nr:transcription factor E2F3-like [Sapajus apella]